MNYLDNWDWLIILDACRFDLFKRLWSHGNVAPRLSLGSCTVEVLERMPRFEDSILITGHPFPLLRKDKFDFIVDVGFDFTLDTSPPWLITNYVRRRLRFIETFKRKILWFLQPHHPYIGEFKLKVPIHADKDAQVFTLEAETIERLRRLKRQGLLEKAYESNLKLILEYVEKILPLMKGKIVVTSDHGEGLGIPLRPGDKPVFSHPCGHDEWEVRVIPWAVVIR